MADTKNKTSASEDSHIPPWVIVIAWLWVGLPLAWGVAQTLTKAADLFK
jgi:hypothetical protein